MGNKTKPEYIFQCLKCSHIAYIDKAKILKIIKKDCPECGEEPYENWLFIGEGNFEKEYPHLVTKKK